MDALADRVIRTHADSDGRWLEWIKKGHAPHVAFEQWLAPDDRLVVVAPHPDDEVLACGGLLAMHAERGSECAVIAVTDGDASHDGCDGWDAASLAKARRAESREGLARLGVGLHAIERIGLPDGKVQANASTLNDALHCLLRAGDTVVTTWRLDGHPDHDATGKTVAKVCTAIGARLIEAPVWMWHWAKPNDMRVPWHRLRSLALPARARERKAAALEAHMTQRTPRRRVAALVDVDVDVDADADRGEAPSEAPVLDCGILQRAAWQHEYFFI